MLEKISSPMPPCSCQTSVPFDVGLCPAGRVARLRGSGPSVWSARPSDGVCGYAHPPPQMRPWPVSQPDLADRKGPAHSHADGQGSCGSYGREMKLGSFSWPLRTMHCVVPRRSSSMLRTSAGRSFTPPGYCDTCRPALCSQYGLGLVRYLAASLAISHLVPSSRWSSRGTGSMNCTACSKIRACTRVVL